eukprot:Lankesteria_metandrocarpae@DN9394_c0_g1_i1.p1
MAVIMHTALVTKLLVCSLLFVSTTIAMQKPNGTRNPALRTKGTRQDKRTPHLKPSVVPRTTLRTRAPAKSRVTRTQRAPTVAAKPKHYPISKFIHSFENLSHYDESQAPDTSERFVYKTKSKVDESFLMEYLYDLYVLDMIPMGRPLAIVPSGFFSNSREAGPNLYAVYQNEYNQMVFVVLPYKHILHEEIVHGRVVTFNYNKVVMSAALRTFLLGQPVKNGRYRTVYRNNVPLDIDFTSGSNAASVSVVPHSITVSKNERGKYVIPEFSYNRFEKMFRGACQLLGTPSDCQYEVDTEEGSICTDEYQSQDRSKYSPVCEIYPNNYVVPERTVRDDSYYRAARTPKLFKLHPRG